MSNTAFKSIVTIGSAVLFVAAVGTHAFGDGGGSASCRDLHAEITAIRHAVGVVDGKVDQSNQSIAAIALALGVVDGKVNQSNIDLAIIRAELQQIRDALSAQAQANGGLQLQVDADQSSCVLGAVQCASATLPSNVNQIPVELKLLVLSDQVSVTNLEIADFDMSIAFSPAGGPNVTACAVGETGCGSPEFFINRGNGAYQLWVHPPTDNWVSGTYSLLLRVTDTTGHVAVKLLNVPISAASGNPGPLPTTATPAPGSGFEKNQKTFDAVD